MKVIAVIPARYAASRFPGKLLKPLGNKTVLAHTFLAVRNSGLFDEVIIAADDQRIFDEMQQYNAQVLMTSPNHPSGSDRIAEAIQDLDVDVVVNVQGDEPFILPETLQLLVNVFMEDTQNQVDVATLKEKIVEIQDAETPNNVKVVTDNQNFALYFSRSLIPFDRECTTETPYFKHVGIYAYRKSALLAYTQLAPSFLEITEKLEQLRYLENGFRIKVVETKQKTIGIDTAEDLEKAEAYLKQLEQ